MKFFKTKRLSSAILVGLISLTIVALAGCPAPQSPEQQASAHFQKGKQLYNPNLSPDSDTNMGAIAEWEKAVEINPRNEEAQFQLGLAYKKLGDYLKDKNSNDLATKSYQLSIIHYRKAIELNPNDPATYNNLANVYYVLGDYDGSIEGYMKAILLKPYEADYHYNVANAYGKKGLTSQAIEHYNEAIRIDQNYFDAYYNLANLYEKIGDIPNAIRYYQEYVNRETRQSEAQWVEQARQKVLKLRGGAIY